VNSRTCPSLQSVTKASGPHPSRSSAMDGLSDQAQPNATFVSRLQPGWPLPLHSAPSPDLSVFLKEIRRGRSSVESNLAAAHSIDRKSMNQKLIMKPGLLRLQSPTDIGPPLVEVAEASATKGEWASPASEKVCVALALSNFSARWRGPRGLKSEDVSAGTLAICEFNRSQQFEMRSAADFGIVLVEDEALQQAAQEIRATRPELEPHDVLQDLTLRRLIQILLHEKQAGFQSGLFFLDSIAASLANYLVRHYSVSSPTPENSSGGLAPSVLRRCIEFIETHLEGNLRLNDLAHEASLSTSHLIRSFRQSTGKTPYQFLLHRRIERARSLILSDHRTPLTEVALATGFADQHHLARVFRRVTGVTPSSYRRSL
jgi:AraC family transcriptional regulator